MDPFAIIAVRKDARGNLTHFKLENAQEIDYQQAINMAKSGQLKGVDVMDRKDGRQILRSEPDDNKKNNLDNLPGF